MSPYRETACFYTKPHRAPTVWTEELNRDTRPMPNALREGPYRLFFYSSDCNEPMHVHVKRDRSEAKFWL